MKRLVLGPTFEQAVGGDVDAAVERLNEWIRSDACAFDASGVGSHFQFAIRRDSGRHFWSPWLTLDVRDEGNGAAAHGRFNPSPGIWTAYILSTLGLIVIGFVAAMWGWSEWQLNRTPWALSVIPVCAVVSGLMWWASAIGQRMAGDEMREMEDAVRELLR